MRIIAGSAKGRILTGPKSERIRPALDKVKGAIFNILYDVTGRKVLDVFAGTGSIGLEALSRGAASCVFIDRLPEALALLRKNIERCGFESSATVLKLEAPRELKRAQKLAPFDLIFVDPPYDKGLVNPTLAAITREKILAQEGIVIVEHSPRELIESEYRLDRTQSVQSNGANGETAEQQMGVRGRAVSPLTIKDQRKYGQTIISFLYV